MFDDVRPNAFGGRGRKRHEWHGRKMLAQFGKLAVFGPEIVAPFADAMRFIHRDEADLPPLQIAEKTGEHEPFRRDVEEAVFAIVQAAQAGARFVWRK